MKKEIFIILSLSHLEREDGLLSIAQVITMLLMSYLNHLSKLLEDMALKLKTQNGVNWEIEVNPKDTLRG